MPSRTCSTVLLGLLVGASTSASAEDQSAIIKTTICEIVRNRSQYEGKEVEVVANFDERDDYHYIYDPHCLPLGRIGIVQGLPSNANEEHLSELRIVRELYAAKRERRIYATLHAKLVGMLSGYGLTIRDATEIQFDPNAVPMKPPPPNMP